MKQPRPWWRSRCRKPRHEPLPREVSRIGAADTERMQNEYKSTATGKVTKIFVQEGAAVETAAPLVAITVPEA